ncbi:MAG TPA: DUF3467 domain-containing protein [Planctomycetaceae bacterium]|nr:DUF3467 domain-containing protein [Planctomycetaceae bacterium]
MAKEKAEQTEAQAEETQAAEAQAQAPAEGQAQAAPQQQRAPQGVPLQVNDVNAVACYANFCRVTGSPEELIIDFGLNPQPVGVPKDPIEVKQRVIMNFYTAKRLLAALQMSVQRHEAVFGVLETDVQKRLRPQFQQQQQAGQNA